MGRRAIFLADIFVNQDHVTIIDRTRKIFVDVLPHATNGAPAHAKLGRLKNLKCVTARYS
jgi:hypothetical protein